MTTTRVARSVRIAGLLMALAGILTFEAPGGTTGKIVGRVMDTKTREPIIGATVVIQGTSRGAATDPEGDYFITNVPPGKYELAVSVVGYQRQLIKNVVVTIDLTTRIDVKLDQTVVETGEVIIEAERPLVQKDLTSSSVTITAEDIKMIPVDNPIQVVNLQAGVVGGHFRGGRMNEVAYLVDGITVTDPFNGGLSLQVENPSVREMEVISGTFNAEYGQAMSGVVNIVTQEGSASFHGSLIGDMGDYFTKHTDVFENNDTFNPTNLYNLQMSLGGPLGPTDLVTFFVTGRYFNDDGYLYGPKIYNTYDSNPYYPTGSGDYVSMSPYRKKSINAKVTLSEQMFKASYSFFWDDSWNKYYDHGYKWTPEGIMNHYRTNIVHGIQLTHVPSASTFQSLKYSYNDFDYEGYVYKNPYDSLRYIDGVLHVGYVDPSQGTPQSGYTFRSGGNQPGRYERSSSTNIIQWQLTSQLSKQHKVGGGIETRIHAIYNHGYEVVNLTEEQTDSLGNPVFTLGYRAPGTIGNQSYTKYPLEVSGYLQDKMEYDIMIINAGVRFDYFKPNSSYPKDLRNPTNNPDFPGADSTIEANAKVQVSPRLGVSFPISDQGIIHFSYGHFFQIPSFENLYYNSEYLISEGGQLSSVTGNPDLEAERTTMYEVGLQQVIFPLVSLDFTAYYRDIRNLLGQEIINTYEGVKYARFVNRDYANVRGVIVSLERRFADYFGAKVDYTYQFAEGNASDPYSVYNNNQTDPPIETNKKAVPLNWDQRNTVNLSLTVGKPTDWNVGFIFQYGSGFPYTEDVRMSQGLRFENGGKKPPTFNLDMRAEKRFALDKFSFNIYLLVYNLLDTMNEVNVDPASGRANVDLFTQYSGPIIGLNTLEQYLNNPTSFSAPRQVRFGLTIDF